MSLQKLKRKKKNKGEGGWENFSEGEAHAFKFLCMKSFKMLI